MYLCTCVQVIFAGKCNMVVVALIVLTVKACSHCKRTEKRYRSHSINDNLTWLRTNLVIKIKEVLPAFLSLSEQVFANVTEVKTQNILNECHVQRSLQFC